MRFRTRRILEIATAIVALAVLLDLRGLGTGKGRDDAARLDLVRDIYRQELLAKYSPGDGEGYRLLFGHEEGERIPGTDEVIDWSSIQNVILGYRIRGGFEAVPEAPDWFHHELDRTEAQVHYLREVLETGPYVSALSPHSLLNFLSMQWAAKTIRMLAVRDWLRGNEEQAAEDLSTIFELGDALDPSCLLISQLIRLRLYGIGVEGYDSLTWTDPGAPENLLILAALENTGSDQWSIPPQSRDPVSNVLLYSTSFTENPLASLDYYAASSVLLSWLEPPDDSDTERLLGEAGILPNPAYSFLGVSDRMSRWTTIRAMQRRAQQVPESFYETDPWMSAESAKRMPPLIYLLSRVDPPDNRYRLEEAQRRLDVVRWKTRAIENAYRVRVWGDEHKHWPTPDEFNVLLQAGPGLDYHILTDPAPLVNRFLAIHDPDLYHRYGFTWDWDPNNPSRIDCLVFQSTMPVPDLRSPRGGPATVIVPGFGPFGLQVVTLTFDFASWVAEILRVPAFVESVEVDEIERDESLPPKPLESHITAHLRLPEKSYWITHPGPDGLPDGPGLEYDPSNGTVSRGDIVQLAGWE